MKKYLFLILFFLSFQYYFSQEKEWNSYDLDSIVYLEMPFVVYENDSITENTEIYEMYSENNTSKYLAQKLSLGSEYVKSIKTILPKDAKSLKNFYLDFIDVLNEYDGFYLEYGGTTTSYNLQGYRFYHKNNVGKNLYESNIFYVNENLYLFSYYDENGLQEIDRKRFFDSIVFISDYKLHQYTPKKMSSTKKIAIGLIIILLISFILRVNSKRKKNT